MAGLFEHDILETDMAPHEMGDSLIKVIDTDLPLTRMFGKGRQQRNKLAVWGAYFPNEEGDIARREGEDKTEGWQSNIPVTLRSMVQLNRSQGWMVTDLAAKTMATWAKTEHDRVNQQRLADFETFTLMREAIMAGGQFAEEAGAKNGNKNRTTGMFGWLNPNQPKDSLFAVPPECRLSASEWLAKLPTLAEFRALMLAAGIRMSRIGKWTGVVGPKLASHMNDWVIDNTKLNDVTKTIVNEKLKLSVSAYQFAEGLVEFFPHFRMLRSVNGKDTPQSQFSGAFIRPEMWRTAFMQAIEHKPGVDGGGGVRGFWEDMFVLQCLNPLGQFAIYSDGKAA